jgi:ferredoxin, 2Fe-2S
MPQLIVTLRDGSESIVEGTIGRSLMEVMRDGGASEIQGMCGGCCSCCTCHVHVESSRLAELPPMSEQENDLLSCSDDRESTSRLACQIPMTPQLDGLRLTIAKTD